MIRGFSTNLKHKRSIAYAVIASAVFSFIALLLAPTLLPSSSFADEPITVNPNITIGGSGSISLTVNPGNFAASNPQPIVVTTSNYTGYTMTIAPTVDGDNTDLVNSDVNTTIPSISTELTSTEFTNLNSTRYGLSIDDGANYLPVVSGSTIKSTSTATNATTGAFNLTLGAKVATTAPAGTYTKTFNLTAMANTTTYAIAYNANAGDDSVNDMPSANESTISGTTVIISSKSPKREGYNFLGWAESPSATTAVIQPGEAFILDPESNNEKHFYGVWQQKGIRYFPNIDGAEGEMGFQTKQMEWRDPIITDNSNADLLAPNYWKTGYSFVGWNTKADGSGTMYGPMETIVMPPNGYLELFAQWTASSGIMQGWTGCANLNAGSIIGLTDIRDGQVYSVAKLADGKCWMVDDLRLDLATANIAYENTDNPTQEFLTLLPFATSANNDQGVWQGWWDLEYNSNEIRYNHGSTSASYGDIYNLYTASAGHGTYEYTTIRGSICPNSWSLPSANNMSRLDLALGGNGSVQQTIEASQRWRVYPNNFMMDVGFHATSDVHYNGDDRSYITSTQRDNGRIYNTTIFRDQIIPGNAYMESFDGFSVRCLITPENNLPNNTYTVHFNANTTDYVDGEMAAQIVNSDVATYLKTNAFSYPLDGTILKAFKEWNTQPDGSGTSYKDGARIYNLATAGNEITLYAQWTVADRPLLVNLHSDSKSSFANSEPLVSIGYKNDCETIDVVSPIYSHTPNLLDDGTRNMEYNGGNGNGNYANGYTKNEVLSILGAKSIRIDLTYGGESATYDWASIWEGEHPEYTALNDYDALEKVLLGSNVNNKYGGTSGTTVSGVVFGTDTITIAYRSDTSVYGNGFGYYAVITGLDAEGYPLTGSVNYCVRDLVGSYQEPVAEDHRLFVGWSETENDTTATYKSEKEIRSNLLGNNGEIKNLYPVWNNQLQIVFNGNGSTSGSMDDQYLVGNDTVLLNKNNYLKKYWGFTGWNTQPDGTGTSFSDEESYSVGVISPGTILTLYAQWKPYITIQYDDNGATSDAAMTPQTVLSGETIRLRRNTLTRVYSNIFEKENWRFEGWNTEADGAGTSYQENEAFVAPIADEPMTITMYAMWSPNMIVTYSDNYNESPETLSQVVGRGLSWTTYSSTTFTRELYKIGSWNTTPDGSGTVYEVSSGYTAPSDNEDVIYLNLYAQWVPAFEIIYDSNDETDMIFESGISLVNGDETGLIAPNFRRQGYGFIGWNTKQDGTGTQYGPNETIIITNEHIQIANEDRKIVLYAQWLQSSGELQSFSCSSLTEIGDIAAYTDNRDGETYAVAKLADGNCWMIENLRLDPAGKTLNANNTNNPLSSFANTVSNLQESSFADCTSTSSSTCLNRYSVGLGNIRGTDTASYSNESQNTPWYSYGVTYNWYTATAGHGTYSKTSGTTDGDICPTGWHLPYGGSGTGVKGGNTKGGFYYLNYKLNNNTNKTNAAASNLLRSFPNNMVLSGYYYGARAYSRGGSGYYWTSTAYSSGNAKNYSIYSSGLSPNTDYYKFVGHAIRCVATNDYKVHFDANAQDATGTMIDQTSETDVDLILSKNSFSRPASEVAAYLFTGWNTRPDGHGTSYADEESVINIAASGTTITLYAQWEQVGPLMTVNYHGNGLSFADSSTSNTTYYYNDCQDVYLPTAGYSHTPNLLDNGERNTSYNGATVNGSTAGNYANNYTKNEVITIPGASKLHVKLTYAGESSSWDWVSVWSGEHTGYTATDDYDAAEKVLLGGNTTNKYGGSSGTTVEGNVAGTDTVTFAFKSDGSGAGNGYGYYAVVTGYDSNDNLILDSITTNVCTRSLISGEYKNPVVSNNQEFLGWSENQNATTADYANASEALNNLPGNNGETKTLYAVWRNLYVMTFVNTATNTSSTKKVVVDQSTTVSSTSSFSRSGYKLVGWDTVTNDASDNAGTVVYTNGQSITPSSDMTFYSVWRPAYQIVYHANGSTDGTMDNHTNVAEGDSLELYASNFARANYGFAGWSPVQVDPDSANALTTINSLGSQGLIYGPNATITAPSFATYGTVVDNANTIYLYAVWVPKDTTYNLQTFSSSNRCSTMSEGEVIALQDSRDTNVYAVAKLKDDNCWMVENLRLDPAGKTLDSTNTNNPESTFASTVSGLQSSSFATCASNSSACDDQYSVGLGNITLTNTTNRTSGNQTSRWYSYGVMYNWYTATAGHGTYSKSSGTTDGDICPAGWHLPYGGSDSGIKGGNTSGGFYYLNYKLNNNANVIDATASSNIRKYPNNFVYTGSFTGPGASGRGSVGYYGSSMAYDNTMAGSFYFNRTMIYNPGGISKYSAYAVRCLATHHHNISLTFGTGVASVEVDGVTYSSNTVLSLAENSTHTINMTFQSGYEFDSWSISGTGTSVASISTNPTTLIMGTASATLAANAIESEPGESGD